MNVQLLIDLHKKQQRQGPGGTQQTNLALQLTGLNNNSLNSQPLRILDIGCGTGASTLLLAQNLNAQITALDLFPEFLEILQKNAQKLGLADQLSTLACSMDELPFAEDSFDLIWSEGAIYNMGFANGIADWQCFLKPNGILAVSEITWLSKVRPIEITQYWETQYPEIATAAEKIRICNALGLTLKAYFSLPEDCWLDNYYHPLEQSFVSFLTKHKQSPEAKAIVTQEKREIAVYKKYHDYYSYGFYILQKTKLLKERPP